MWMLKASKYGRGSEDLFEVPNLIFCSVLFLFTVLMIANSGNRTT